VVQDRTSIKMTTKAKIKSQYTKMIYDKVLVGKMLSKLELMREFRHIDSLSSHFIYYLPRRFQFDEVLGFLNGE
jgi:hypothetical protein